MKEINLGLDLGTNSIGWALVEKSFVDESTKIIGLGSRIIPMNKEVLDNFGKGITESQIAARTGFRGVRRLVQRDLLRRERLHRVLNILGFLPEHYANEIDFEEHFGQFKESTEPKLVYKKDEHGKFKFIFMVSFYEMLEEFKLTNPGYLAEGKKIPLDWTIYYLRKKALTDKITKEELAWLLLNFNQKRGYHQLRGEEESAIEVTQKTTIEFDSQIITEITDTGKIYKDNKVINIKLENGIEGKIFRKEIPNWIGIKKDLLITTDIDKDGNNKIDDDGKISRRIKIPTEQEWEEKWALVKMKTERDIDNSYNKMVGCFIYKSLLQNPSQKINGKLVRTIERKFYKKELDSILNKQMEFHPELQDAKLYNACLEELYQHNDAHKNNIKQKSFSYLFIDDIIFYQRPLKSKTSQISDCKFETKRFIKDGVEQVIALKCIATSHPLFQEFRLLQFVKNIKIIEKVTYINEKLTYDVDVTNQYFKTESDWLGLFKWLNDKNEITQKQLLAYPKLKLKEDKYRWNFVEDKAYPCNETRSTFLNKVLKIDGIDASFFDDKNTEDLWHILYSVTDKIEIVSAISKFAKKHQLNETFVTVFSKLKPYDKNYGAYSAKALKKLLSIMRSDNNWDEAAIDIKTKGRINNIINGEYDETILNRVRDKAINLTHISHFKNLPLWLASYIVYDRHSEANDIAKWKTPADIDYFLKFEFKQHSLRNPIVEQVITETLRVVRDVWIQYGNNNENFFDEIHIELGREMKNDKKTRERITKTISENENTNLRIKAILTELKNDGINDVRPYSPSQQEILKIYEEGVYFTENRKDKLDEIDKIRKSNKPTTAEINKYKLWLEQGYLSPYTGQTIKLSQLFTIKYQIEHIFPQARLFDDSLNNKIICEAEVNQLKDKYTAYEFIKKCHGQIVTLSGGATVKIFEVTDYESHVNRNFAKNRIKQKNLLSEDIPEGFINRQMNDSRYISKIIKTLLSKIVREEKNGELEQEATSKNIVSLPGAITSKMKQDWGLNDVWNDLITPRFERLNIITNSTDFGQWENKQGHKVFQTTVPDDIAAGFSKKRIDHRHHALDALVIACITKNHINYLNNLNGKDAADKTIKYDLRTTLCLKTKTDDKGNYKWEFKKPWATFTQDVRKQLQETVISFKQNIRVINKTNNKYQKWIADTDAKMKKEVVKQTKGDNWAIRKPLHKETIYGKVRLLREKPGTIALSAALDKINLIVNKDIKAAIKAKAAFFKNNIIELKKHFKEIPIEIDDKIIDRVIVYEEITATANRVTLDISFDKSKIESITDTGIQKILLSHLEKEKFQNIKDDKGKVIPPHEAAFATDGLEEMNAGLLNHKPIYKVRIYEEGNRFAIGQTGNKQYKYAEAAKGTNLFFAVYQNSDGIRNYDSLPLIEIIESQKKGLSNAPQMHKTGSQLLFTLSPNDLVYVPTNEEADNPYLVDFNKLNKQQVSRIYKMVSCTGGECHFTTNNYASEIIKNENGSNNKNERLLQFFTENGLMDEVGKKTKMIKAVCWKLKVNRLGCITKY